MRTVLSVPYSYDVLVSEDGRHYVEVCCGGIAMYLARIELTADEIAAFRTDPGSIERLVRQVQQNGKRP